MIKWAHKTKIDVWAKRLNYIGLFYIRGLNQVGFLVFFIDSLIYLAKSNLIWVLELRWGPLNGITVYVISWLGPNCQTILHCKLPNVITDNVINWAKTHVQFLKTYMQYLVNVISYLRWSQSDHIKQLPQYSKTSYRYHLVNVRSDMVWAKWSHYASSTVLLHKFVNYLLL